MGREASCVCRLGSESGQVKALLESHQLILRGAFKRTYAIPDLHGVEIVAEALRFQVGTDQVELDLGAAEASRWAQKMAAPPRSLAAKLGLNAENRAFVIGEPRDEALAAALTGMSTAAIGNASMVVAIVRSESELAVAQATHERLAPRRHLWVVYPKGRGASPSDSLVRQFLRGLGYVDSKTSGVSDALTATRYTRS